MHVRFRTQCEERYGLTILTEPDVVLIADEEIFLIEAKFCSSNSVKHISLWKDFEIDKNSKKRCQPYTIRYKPFLEKSLNIEYIDGQNEFYSQLVRYIAFASYAYDSKRFYLVSLIPADRRINKEVDTIENGFKPYLKRANIFKVMTWETIYNLVKGTNSADIDSLKNYLIEKTVNLRKAFSGIV